MIETKTEVGRATSNRQSYAAGVQASFPRELQERAQWIVWRYEDRGGKKTKMPYSPLSGPKKWRGASTAASTDWGTFRQAAAAHEDGCIGEGGFDGIGYVFTLAAGVVGIDFDHCLDPATGAITQEDVKRFVARFASYTEISPSGSGLHVFVRGTIPRSQRKGPIEAYNNARYFTVTGRIFGEVREVRAAQAELNDFYEEVFGDDESRHRRGEVVDAPVVLDDDEIIRRAREETAGQCFLRLFDQGDRQDPRDESRIDASNADFRLCCILAKYSGNIAQIDRIMQRSALMRDKWNRRDGVYKTYGIRTIVNALDAAVKPELAEINRAHAAIRNYGGRFRILHEFDDPILKRNTFEVQRFHDFALWLGNRTVPVVNAKDREVKVPLPQWWCSHPRRRQYQSVLFLPGKDTPQDIYNMWQGFAVEPLEGDCHLYLDHLKNIVCGGDPAQYHYLVRWMANAVQRPYEPGYAGVVLRGDEGAGKGIGVEGFGLLWGRHFLQVNQPEHISGHFNKHLQDVVVLFGDEVFSTHNRAHVNAIKRIVTETTMTIEGKGLDATSERSYLHLILASNDDWVVSVKTTDRRFFCATVDNRYAEENPATTKAEKRAYFNAILAERANGGSSALLHYLLHYDLEGFNVRDIPRTPAHAGQCVASLEKPVHKFLYDALASGSLPASRAMSSGGLPRAYFTLVKDTEDAYFITYGGVHALVADSGHASSQKEINDFLSQVGFKRRRPRANARRRGFVFPPLREARRLWSSHFVNTTWGDTEDDTWAVEGDVGGVEEL